MKTIMTAAVCIAMATGASAQISNFEGLSGAVKLNSVATLLGLTGEEGSFPTGEQSLGGSVQLAFGFVASPSTVISVGAEFGLGKAKGADFKGIDIDTQIDTKEQLSLYVEPGWLINDTTLAYGKLSHEAAKFVRSADGSKVTKSSKGTGFGFGIRTMLNKASFLQVEVKQADYSSVDFVERRLKKPKATVGSIGVGIRF
jgi:hypothetical protein